MEYGRIEENGLRCCYHGWYFNAQGKCLDQPGEPDESPYKDEVRQPWYPAEEYRGLVFVYMGPLDKKPLLPRLHCYPDPKSLPSSYISHESAGSLFRTR